MCLEFFRLVKKNIFVWAILIIFFGFSPIRSFSQSMSNYCSVPPFLISSVTPNVLFIVDNSGSMKFPAYWPSNLSRRKTDSSFDPDRKYYGIFDPNSQYSYDEDGDYFYKDSNGDWSGNFLNWLTMRRYDILLRVLIGGNYKKIGNNEFLQGFNTIEKYADELPYTGYKFMKKYEEDEADNYFPYDYNDDTFYVGVDYDGSNKTRNDRYWFEVDGDRYAIRVKINGKPKGILQEIPKKVRVGLMIYNHGNLYEDGDDRGDGGKVYSYISDNNTGLASLYLDQDVYDKNKYPPKGYPPLYPHTYTPLAETYYEAIRYFEAKQSAYNAGVDYSNHDPIQYRCQKNFVILITDGESTKDENVPGTCFGGYTWPVSDTNFNVETWMDKIANEEGYDSEWCSNLSEKGTYYLEGAAYYAHVSDLRSNLPGKQNLTLYTIYTFGKSQNARKLLKTAAKYGGFTDLNGNGKPDLQAEWDKNGDGIPDNYLGADNGYLIEDFIRGTIAEILKQVSAGTPASILATNDSNGSLILQALFYPKKSFDNDTEINWPGTLKNLWFYMGPFAQNIREDTDENKVLNLFNDYVIQFYFDNSTNTTKAHVFKDSDGDGKPDTSMPDESISDVKYLWDAGLTLWRTSPDSRKIFTDLSGLYSDPNKGNFIDSNAPALKDYLDVDNDSLAKDVIDYIRGEDINGYRKRTVTIGSETHVWKLGDIVYSTPKIVSSSPLNDYNRAPPYGYNDDTYRQFIDSEEYKNRAMVFVGANDGMLHAFRLGKVIRLNSSNGNIAKLTKVPAEYTLGSEAWAFIPKNVLPYLKYYMDEKYCHIYFVDLTPYVFDASIEAPGVDNRTYPTVDKTQNSWRTILVGGLNLGGACGDNSTEAIHPPNDTGNVPDGLGLSSYFAIDITDPENPEVLWEFSDNNTAFTTTGPAIIHIPAKRVNEQGEEVDDTRKDGYWYVVFASGPDNYDGTVHQPLYLYILDLKTGRLKRKIQLSGTVCTVGNNDCFKDLIGGYSAFAGRMFDSSIDLNTDYSDDAVYFGYNYYNNGWKGGVLRLTTEDDPDPNHWKVSKLIGGLGPITAGIRTLQDKNNNALWVYFGGGRYFKKMDDPSAQRRIYGVKDPCYDNGGFIGSCNRVLSLSDLTDVTDNGSATINNDGWYIDLSPQNSSYDAERLISDPVVSSNGWVFYTTFSPTSDVCGFGGNTYMWMVNYSNGGTPINPNGTIYLQVSTGAIRKINLQNSFGEGQEGYNGSYQGRKYSTPIPGAPPPQQAITYISPPPPMNKVVNWEEK